MLNGHTTRTRKIEKEQLLGESKQVTSYAQDKTGGGAEDRRGTEVAHPSQEQTGTTRKLKKQYKHLRSKSTSEMNRLRKHPPKSEINDGKVKATKVKDDKMTKISPKTKMSGKETKKNLKVRKHEDELRTSDPLQKKLRELLDLIKGSEAEGKVFINPHSLDHAATYGPAQFSSGEPSASLAQNSKLKQRPQSAKLERKPSKPKVRNRPQSARSEKFTNGLCKLTQRHRTTSSDSMEEIKIDTSNVKRDRPPSGSKAQRNDSERHAFCSDILSVKLDEFETDLLAWDVDVSDCMTGTPIKKKRPVSGE